MQTLTHSNRFEKMTGESDIDIHPTSVEGDCTVARAIINHDRKEALRLAHEAVTHGEEALSHSFPPSSICLNILGTRRS
jgi:hypothetical protein